MADPATTSTTDQYGVGDALKTILELYKAHQASKPGTFRQVPQSPEETAMRQKMLGFVDNSPTRNGLMDVLRQYSQGARVGGDFHLPTSQGYAPGQTPSVQPYDPNQRYGPSLDFSKLIGAYNGMKSGATAAMPTSLPGANIGGPNGANSGVFAPAGSTGDPFGAQNTAPADPNAANITWDQVKQYGPSVMKIVGGILTANPGMSLGGAWSAFQAWHKSHSAEPLPTYPQTGQPSVTPGGGFVPQPPRQNWDTPQGPGYNDFWTQQNANMMAGPGGPGGDGGPGWGKFAP